MAVINIVKNQLTGYYMLPSGWKQNTLSEVFFSKKKIKLTDSSLGLTTNLQKIEGSVEDVDGHVGMQSAKSRLWKTTQNK